LLQHLRFVDEPLWASFSTNNSNVASVDDAQGFAIVSLNNPGSATVTGSALVDIAQPGCDPGVAPPYGEGEPGPIICCGCTTTSRSDSTSVSVSTPQLNLSCPASVIRGQSADCNASVTNVGSGATINLDWKFTDGASTVTRSCVTTTPGCTKMGRDYGQGGTVTVTAKVNQTDLPAVSRTITVTNRAWHTNPASPTQVPNGTISPPLPVPPQPTGDDSGLGVSEEQTGDGGFASTLIQDNGPNHGFAYFASPLNFPFLFFRYTINPDLENSGSVFSQHQCGNYDPSTNPGGFISWINLFTQTRRHEFNSTTQSHHAFYSSAMNLSINNPGDYFESRVASPGVSLAQFEGDTRTELNARYARIFGAARVEPFAVNQSETGMFLGNVNYIPYASCN
jgi:hypothetical protein